MLSFGKGSLFYGLFSSGANVLGGRGAQLSVPDGSGKQLLEGAGDLTMQGAADICFAGHKEIYVRCGDLSQPLVAIQAGKYMVIDGVSVVAFSGLRQAGKPPGAPLDGVLGQGGVFGVIAVLLNVAAQLCYLPAERGFVLGIEVLFAPVGERDPLAILLPLLVIIKFGKVAFWHNFLLS